MARSIIKSNTMKAVNKLAHKLTAWISDWSKCLKCAWALHKLGLGAIVEIAFAKETGELRTAVVKNIVKTDFEKGTCKFIEITENGDTQFRAFRFERFIERISNVA